MLVPVSWLKEYVELNLPIEKLADRLSLAGMEVEEIRRQGDWWDPATILVGQVVSVKQHPKADRLTLVDVDHPHYLPPVLEPNRPVSPQTPLYLV